MKRRTHNAPPAFSFVMLLYKHLRRFFFSENIKNSLHLFAKTGVSDKVVIGKELPNKHRKCVHTSVFPPPALLGLRGKLLVGDTPNPGRTAKKGVRADG